jgi:hypothetical protein
MWLYPTRHQDGLLTLPLRDRTWKTASSLVGLRSWFMVMPNALYDESLLVANERAHLQNDFPTGQGVQW